MKIEKYCLTCGSLCEEHKFLSGGMPLIFWYCPTCRRRLSLEEARYIYSKRVASKEEIYGKVWE